MSSIKPSTGPQGEISLPKITIPTKGEERIIGLMLQCQATIGDVLAHSSGSVPHNLQPLHMQVMTSLIKRSAPDLAGLLPVQSAEDLEDRVTIAMALFVAKTCNQAYAEHTLKDNPAVRLISHENKTFVVLNEKGSVEEIKKLVDKIKVELKLSDTDKVFVLEKDEFEKIEQFSKELSECFNKELKKEQETQSRGKTAKAGGPISSSVVQLKTLDYALAVHTTAIRILASTTLEQMAKQGKKIEKQIQEERIENERERKAEEKAKEIEVSDLMQRILKEEISRFELLHRTIDTGEDIKQFGHEVSGLR